MRIEPTKDVELIRPLAGQWLAECHAHDFGFEPTLDDIMSDLQGFMDTGNGVLLIARDVHDKLVGFFSCFIFPNYMHGGSKLAVEKYWYAAPNETWVGPRLFREGFNWAREQHCTHFMVSASHMMPENHDSIVEFCKSAGMRPFETIMLRELV